MHYPRTQGDLATQITTRRRKVGKQVDASVFSTPPPGRWVFDAACGAEDVPEDLREAFTAETVSGTDLDRAQDLCLSCPVFDACHEYAEDTRPAVGVWAGTFHRRHRTVRYKISDPAQLDRHNRDRGRARPQRIEGAAAS